MGRRTGFTLLELLVALAVFSMVSVMAYSGLRTVLQSKQQTDLKAARIQQLQSAILMLERDFSQIVPRAVRDEYGDESAALVSSDYGAYQVALTHGGRRNPTALARSTLQRVAYGVEEDQLLRFSWPILDRAQDAEPYRAAMLDDVRELSIRYLDSNSEWQTQWPPSGLSPNDPVPMPKAVELTLELVDMGEIRRLFPLFDEAMAISVSGSGSGGITGTGGEEGAEEEGK
jgi:general secretion pathway protein J